MPEKVSEHQHSSLLENLGLRASKQRLSGARHTWAAKRRRVASVKLRSGQKHGIRPQRRVVTLKSRRAIQVGQSVRAVTRRSE